jgi:hypothetical protein
MNSAKGTLVCFQLRSVALFVGILVSLSRANLHAQVLPEGGALLEFIASAQQHFSVLTYAQSYLDDAHERVSYAGTLYAGIHSFKLNECEVEAKVAVQDRYSGAIEHRSGLGRVHYERTGELADDTVYEYRFSLAKLNAGEITDSRARPAQFLSETNFQCQEDQSCSVSWVRLGSREAAISETRTVNGIQDIDAKVSSIVLPMASADLAANAVKIFSTAVRACTATE